MVGGYLEVLSGGDAYSHRLDFITRYDQGAANPYRWTDHGVITRAAASLDFESRHIQNVAFEGTVGDGMLHVSQDLLYHLHGIGRMSEFGFEK